MKSILLVIVFLLIHPVATAQERGPVKVGSLQPRSRLIDWKLSPADALARVDQGLTEVAELVDRAGREKCAVVALPEDTLGLGKWEAANTDKLGEVLPQAVSRMLERLGKAAAAHSMYLVCSNDTLDERGDLRNTAFFLGKDGKEIGRYHKVNMPIHELHKKRGDGFPVFPTKELGGVGMLICYDMVFPEAARCLALNGADIVFHPTLGGAAIGDEEISLAAFRTRAVENFVYLVVSQRGNGSMIISPKGKVLAKGKGPDDLVIAEIDPYAGREGGDAFNHQRDMRARIFRERSPGAFGAIVAERPAVLEKVPATISVEDAARIHNGALTEGEVRFSRADRLMREGKSEEALAEYRALQKEYPDTWIDRVAGERLKR